MTDHKRQHFVPRCHFKPFSANGHGKSVSLFNISSRKIITNAAITGQCYRNFLYGEDLVLEKFFQKVEGQYANVVNNLHAGSNALESAQIGDLRLFISLQYSRTESAMRRIEQAQEGVSNEIFEGRGEHAQSFRPPPASDRMLIMQSLKIGMEVAKIWNDLKFCLLVNRTKKEFVTSDDPTVVTNRFYMQKLRQQNFGLANSGLTIIMPLSPNYAAMFYDGNVYSLSDKVGNYCELRDDRDVSSINEFQYLKANSNIYFKNIEHHSGLIQEFSRVESSRPEKWFRFTTMVPVDGDRSRGEKFRVATEQERTTAQRSLVVFETIYPRPSRWLSKLVYRSKPTTYSDGSAVGLLRKKEWLRGGLDSEFDRPRSRAPVFLERQDKNLE